MAYVKKLRDKRDFWIERFRKVHGDRYGYDDIEHIYWQSDYIEIECRKHGKFKQTAKAHYRGQGCPVCGKEFVRAHLKGNWRLFLDRAEERFHGKYEFPNLQEEYINKNSEITIICKKDNNIFKKKACDFLSSPYGGCRKCYIDSFCEYYTYEELQSLTDIPLKPFEGKVEERKKVKAVCPIHGEYEVLIRTLLTGRGKCTPCGAITSEEEFEKKKKLFIEKDKEIYNGKFSYDISEYKGWSKKMKFKCNDCGFVTNRTPGEHVLNGFRNCNKCALKEASERRVKTNEQFIEESRSIFGDKFLYDRCNYTRSSKKVILGCKKCGKYFEVEANSHLTRHHGCPYHYRNRSKAEDEIIEMIKGFGFNPYLGYRELLENRYELDIFDEKNKLAIEYNGIFWHNENNKTKTYHVDKTEECEVKGIRLLHIFEDEWKNKVKKDIWKSIICKIYNKPKLIIETNRCIVEEIDRRECNEFFEKNHLKGKCRGKIYLGLRFEGELVSAMAFSKTKDGYELLRFCSKTYTDVNGAFQKLFKNFIDRYNPESVTTHLDRRWEVGEPYISSGFEFQNKTPPDYYYVVKDKRRNKYSFRKSILVKKHGCPPDMTEHDFCKSKEWYRIYDCGYLCYKWNN